MPPKQPETKKRRALAPWQAWDYQGNPKLKHEDIATRYGCGRSTITNVLRAIQAQYPLEDIFNADETGLFFRMLPNQTLATSVRKGTKKDKERITLLLTANAAGTEKLKPIVIGKSAQPR